jgi:hypothetical protein
MTSFFCDSNGQDSQLSFEVLVLGEFMENTHALIQAFYMRQTILGTLTKEHLTKRGIDAHTNHTTHNGLKTTFRWSKCNQPAFP